MSTPTQTSIENLGSSAPIKKVWTDEEFMALSDRGRYEIINGELIDMGSSGAKHGYVCSLLVMALMNYSLAQKARHYSGF